MSIQYLSKATVLALVLISASVRSDDRKAGSEEQTPSAVQRKTGAHPQTGSPLLTRPTTKGHTLSSVAQPEMTDTSIESALALPLIGEQIKWQVISGGGGRTVSANYVMSTTVGQAVAGFCSSVNYHLNAGFWQNFTGGGCCLSLSADSRTGNVDADAGKGVDIADLSALIDFLYISFTPPQCMQSANIDGDSQGGVDISDLSALIDFLYISFTAPAVCQ